MYLCTSGNSCTSRAIGWRLAIYWVGLFLAEVQCSLKYEHNSHHLSTSRALRPLDQEGFMLKVLTKVSIEGRETMDLLCTVHCGRRGWKRVTHKTGVSTKCTRKFARALHRLLFPKTHEPFRTLITSLIYFGRMTEGEHWRKSDDGPALYHHLWNKRLAKNPQPKQTAVPTKCTGMVARAGHWPVARVTKTNRWENVLIILFHEVSKKFRPPSWQVWIAIIRHQK